MALSAIWAAPAGLGEGEEPLTVRTAKLRGHPLEGKGGSLGHGTRSERVEVEPYRLFARPGVLADDYRDLCDPLSLRLDRLLYSQG